MNRIHISILLSLLCATTAVAQSDRDHIRRGNRLFRDGNYEKSEVEYKKATEKNQASVNARYNLGCSLMHQGKMKDAMSQFENSLKGETSKAKLAQIYHNMGVILQSQQQYPQAIEMYKNSLRRNPSDDETRYNLALCQKLLKDQPQDNKNNQDKNQNKDQDKDKDKKNQDKKDDKKDQNKDKDKKNDNKNQDKQNQQPKPEPNKMSKENAEQLLDAALRNEKQVQDRMKRSVSPSKRRLQKDW